MMSGQAQLMTQNVSSSLPGFPVNEVIGFQRVADLAGCALQRANYNAQLRCMKEKSTQELIDVMATNNIQGIAPYADNQTVFTTEEYKSKGKAGKFAKVVCYLFYAPKNYTN
jgi:hypothetical protein